MRRLIHPNDLLWRTDAKIWHTAQSPLQSLWLPRDFFFRVGAAVERADREATILQSAALKALARVGTTVVVDRVR
jgi:hypothetical protein